MTNKLIAKPINLPTKLSDLTKFVLVGREKLVAVRAEMRAITKIGLASEVRTQKKEEATMLAGALLDAEARIGTILGETVKHQGGRPGINCSTAGTVLPPAITRKQSHFFQTLAKNKPIIEQVKAQALEKDDLPTRAEVLRRIKRNAEKVRRDKLKQIDKKVPGKLDIIIKHGDFRELSKDLADNSIDLNG